MVTAETLPGTRLALVGSRNGPPVGLNGSLEEFSLQDVLQILALGQKTGQLSLDSPAGTGTILFRAGRVVASWDEGAPSLATSLEVRRDAVLRRRIVASLERLARCRQGEFHFQVSAEPPQRIRGRDIAGETLPSGIDIVELLLEVACRQDEDARGSSDPAPRAPRSIAGSGSRLSVLLVDDEDLVRQLLARYLVEGGYRVVEAGDVESAVERGARLGAAGVRFVLVADLNMPASAGDSFRGGAEVVKRLARLRLRPPVVMMADGAVSSLGARPMRGVWSLVQKPGLSKLDPKEFEADMRALAGRMVEEVLPRVCGALPA
jgi:CheY-like chemotaxis protein